MQKNQNLTTDSEKQPAPTGMMAWVGFGCCVMALTALSISFCSPYWIQTWPNSENKFKNMGLWHVCFHDYMQFKDDSQQLYSECWWVFDNQPKYTKLREWLIPPWFISCQVLTVGCLITQIATVLLTAAIFLHFCPIMNHEYLQTYGVFASGSMMLLVTMVSFVIVMVFGVQSNDRYWMPRPDQNYLSWGFGFMVINGIFSLFAGISLFIEGQNTYNALLRKEDEYTKAALEMSAYPVQPLYPQQQDAYPQYAPGGYAPNYGPSDSNSFEKEPLYDKGETSKSDANGGKNVSDTDKKFRSFDERPTSYTDDDHSGFPPYSSTSYKA